MAYGSIVSSSGTGTSASVTQAGSIADNDILITILFNQFTGRTITPPGGWNAIAGATFTKSGVNRDQNGYQVSSYWKLAASESGAYSFGISSSSQWRAFNVRFPGRNTSSPITGSSLINVNGIAGTSQTYNLPTITAVSGDDFIWAAFGNSGGSGAVWTPPSSPFAFTTRSANSFEGGGASAYLATSDNVAAGATGTVTGTEAGVSCDIGGVMIALAAASVGSTYTLTADKGDYSLLGSAALIDVVLGAAQGSYALNGQTAALNAGKGFSASFGQYSLTGQSAVLVGPAGSDPGSLTQHQCRRGGMMIFR